MSDKTDVKATCRKCSEVVIITVSKAALAEWLGGSDRHIQSVFPDLTPAEREMFLSGICGPCWNKIFDEPSEADSDN